MKVKELIELLKRSPAENIVYVEDKALEQSAGVDDVFIGHGTLSGHSYIYVNAEDWQEERKQIEIYEKLLERAAYMLHINKTAFFPDIKATHEIVSLVEEIRTALNEGESKK